MKTHFVKTGFILLAVIAIASFGATAFAYKGMGKGGCPGKNQGMYQQGNGCPFSGASLSEEDRSKLDEERQAFYNATEELRKNVYEKELELWNELAKADTDAEKAVTLQQTLSDLRGQLDQERVSHFIRMKAIYPDFAKKFNAWNQRPCAGKGFGCGSGGAGGGCRAW